MTSEVGASDGQGDARRAALSAQEPWPGLSAFTQRDAEYFAAREQESDELLERVLRSRLTVLYGLSGLGKTSLLQARLFPALQEQDCLVVSLRLNFTDDAAPLSQQVFAAIEAACTHESARAPSAQSGETLWEYLYRRDNLFWSRKTRLLVPVLVLDQFEELYTLGAARRPEDSRAFVELIADLAEGRAPLGVKVRLDAGTQATTREFDLRRVGCRIVIALREDYLAHLDDARRSMPSVVLNRMWLRPFSREQALDAVLVKGSHFVSRELAQRIVDTVAPRLHQQSSAAAPHVEPALLSLLCRELNKRRIHERRDQIASEWLSDRARAGILRDFYEQRMQQVSQATRAFVEQRLLLPSGLRDSFAVEAALQSGVPASELEQLIAERLLRREDRAGVARIELMHDVLIEPVRESRELRAAERDAAIARARWRKTRRVAAVMSCAVVVLLAAAITAWVQTLRAHAAELRARRERDRADDVSVRAREAARLVAAASVHDDPTTRAALLRDSVSPDARAFMELAVPLLRAPMWSRSFSAESAFTAAAFSPDSRSIALGAADGSARVWGIDEASEARVLTSGGARITAIAWSPDGTRLAAASSDGAVRAWGRDASEAKFVLQAGPPPVLTLAWDANGDRLACGGDDGSVRVRSLNDSSPTIDLQAEDNAPVQALRWSSDESELSSGSDDGVLRMWKLDSRQPIRRPGIQIEHASSSSLWCLDARTVVTSLRGGWGIAIVHGAAPSGSPLRLGELRGRATAVACSPDGRGIAVGFADRTTRVWRKVEMAPLAPDWQSSLAARRGDDPNGLPIVLAGHSGAITTVAWSPDGRSIVTASDDHRARLWCVDELGRLPLLAAESTITSVAWSPDGRSVVAGGRGGAALVKNVEGGTGVVKLARHTDAIAAVAWSPDGRRIVTGSWDATARVWNADGQGDPVVLRGHAGAVDAVAWSPDGSRIATGSWDRTARVWELARPSEPLILRGHEDAVTAIAWSPDGRMLATGSRDSTARIVAADGGGDSTVLQGHTLAIRSLAWNPNSRELATGSEDQSARIWSVPEGRLVRVVSHGATVSSVAWSPDGEALATGGLDAAIRVWTAASELPLIHSDFPAAISAIAWSRDGRSLAVGVGNQVLIEPVSGAAVLDALRMRTPICLSDEQRIATFGETPAEARAERARCEAHLRALCSP